MGKKSRRSKAKAPPSAAAATASTAAARAPLSSGGGKNIGGKNKKSANAVPSRKTANGRLSDPFQPTPKSEIDAITSPHVVSSDDLDPIKAPDGSTCWICLEGLEDGNDEPLRRNCACRGNSQFAHLSCLVECFTSRSEDIWCGRQKAAENTMELAFAWPWETCGMCKQHFSGKLRLDLAREFARSTEGMVGGVRIFRHITAVGWVTKALLESRDQGVYDASVKEFEKCLKLIKMAYPIYENDPNQGRGYNFMSQYLHSHVKQAEGEVLSNYSQTVCFELMRALARNDSSIAEHRKLYNKWHKLITSSIATFEGLKTTTIGMSAPQQIESCLLHLHTQFARMKKDFSLRGFDETGYTEEDEEKAFQLSEQLMNTTIQERGKSSSYSIQKAVMHAQNLMQATKSWKPFVALELLVETYHTAKLSLGPMHSDTRSVLINIGSLIKNQKAANKYDNGRTFCPVDSYDEECDIYFVNTKGLTGTLIDGEEIGEEMGWDPADVILKRGALVKCVDLVKASHLNGKRGWIMDYDEKCERHTVQFEDEDAKSCLVKPGNIRLLFWEGEEYQAGLKAHEDTKKSKPEKDSSDSTPSTAESEQTDENNDDGMPGLY
mmetsp:Transcript_3832/g.8451  ORF Transcript_3832/g.8451 Transcript_3832/m.8451 type:complete len:607 (-) Transcript_3832:185-2005(-)|eukprot:CAMPEP_0183738734 /NCGR_PEP_ID=MMETSP0737-20130205/55351_1 /TAXON_ID=385413 /ORGANISM="Thalassiosira miniscula, Strain CCMP1093" /LENGTH=606 /DNA_ID=CAMNT_0025973341 /DNA_START=83 /DNA_END=1903 /DNA_ORIENTATION=-